MSESNPPTITLAGGDEVDIYDIMQRFRNDGSCEHIIVDALTLLARTGDAGCEWRNDGDAWWTTCGDGFNFDSGTPTENHFKFCCYCGKPLKEIDFDGNVVTPAPPEGKEIK